VFIKPSRKRIEFEKLLKKLGYNDRSPILPIEKKEDWTKQTNYICNNNGALSIYTYIIPYSNKKSYIYNEFLDFYGEEDLEIKIKNLSNRILFEEKTRIFEVGWEVKYNQDPSIFSLEERKKILFHFIKQTSEMITFGCFNLYPKIGDILAANPSGVKINQGFTQSSIILGKRQRTSLAKRFGFGDLYDDDFVYARYDENCILRPI
jgi:hypothetical protein